MVLHNMMFVLAILSIVCFSGPSRADDPFGFEQSGTPDQYSCGTDSLQPPNYYCADAPRKHPFFAHYEIKYHPSIGVCAVVGVSDPISDDERYKSRVGELKRQLEVKYGTLQEHFNNTVTIENGAGIHGGNITKILLWPDFDHNIIRLTFEFIDSQRCEDAARADRKGAF